MSTRTQHTPGPWKIARERNGAAYPAVRGPDGGIVATCGYRVCPESTEDDDNARLIAAAPDLLAACEAAAGSLDVMAHHASETYPHFEDTRGQMDIAAAVNVLATLRAAIARANGKEG